MTNRNWAFGTYLTDKRMQWVEERSVVMGHHFLCQGGVVSDGTPVPSEDSGWSRNQYLSPWHHRRQVCGKSKPILKKNSALMMIFILLSLDVLARVWHYVLSMASFWRMSWACAAACWVSWTCAPFPSDARPVGYLPWEINILLNLGTHRWECLAFASRVNGWSCRFKDPGKKYAHTNTAKTRKGWHENPDLFKSPNFLECDWFQFGIWGKTCCVIVIENLPCAWFL